MIINTKLQKNKVKINAMPFTVKGKLGKLSDQDSHLV